MVTLLSVAFSAFAARSRYCAHQAAVHRKGLPSDKEMKEFQAFVDSAPTPVGHVYMARLRFRHETAAAYKRVSQMPWLPLLLPENPPEYPPTNCSLDFDSPEVVEQARAIFDSAP